MTTRTLIAHTSLTALCIATLTIGCSSDRGGGGSKVVIIPDSGVPNNTADAGTNNTGVDGGNVTGCGTNPNGCAMRELIGAAPGCACLNVCETGYTYNTATMMCDANQMAVCGNGTVEGTEQCDDGNTTNGDGCSSTCQNEQAGVTCMQACQKLFDCTEMQCPGSVDVAGCVQQCMPDPVAFQVDLIDMLSCQEINDQICVTMQETDAGNACMADADCNAGTLQPFCILPTDQMGMPTGWEGGYCTAIGCRGDEECGVNKLCLTIDQMGTTACFLGCDPTNNGMGVCRAGYACPDLTAGMNVGACIPACVNDMDCGAGQTCNTATGQCM